MISNYRTKKIAHVVMRIFSGEMYASNFSHFVSAQCNEMNTKNKETCVEEQGR